MIDYIIGYPCEATFFLKISKRKDVIVSIPVEGMADYIPGYYALPKTTWGKKMVKRVNIVLKKYRDSEEFHKTYEFWLDERSRAFYRKISKSFLN